jgi:hypothetical protein
MRCVSRGMSSGTRASTRTRDTSSHVTKHRPDSTAATTCAQANMWGTNARLSAPTVERPDTEVSLHSYSWAILRGNDADAPALCRVVVVAGGLRCLLTEVGELVAVV